ncbi:helix-turn-helix domain-containing protein [Hominifimenecus sp. rT4P-3]|uniref:helix-turn-helix domain-containing protein n=1 Tax=Hominifimenecus sp. rT4P-3 TaxID=3242979 RepID=UPI003DA5C47D
MRYSYEYKRKCIELYRQGRWPETPIGIKEPKNFHDMIRRWVRMEDTNGPEVLKHKNFNKNWTPEQKLEIVSQVLAGRSLQDAAFSSGITGGLLYQWVQKYKTKGYNGLVNRKKGRPTKEPQMKTKKVNINNPRPLDETEREELIRLRAENEYIKAENEVIKKEIALREEKQAALLKAKKQQSSKNSEKKDTN